MKYRDVIFDTNSNKSKVITADSYKELQMKISRQKSTWQEQWQKRIEAEARRRERENKIQEYELAKMEADDRTSEAEKIQENLQNILCDTIDLGPFDAESLKDFSEFAEESPMDPQYIQFTREPQRSDVVFNPKPGIFTRIFKSKMEAFKNSNEVNFRLAYLQWEKESERIDLENKKIEEQYLHEYEAWSNRKKDFENEQNEENAKVDDKIQLLKKCDREIVMEFIDLSMDRLMLPFDFSQEYFFDYDPHNKMVVMNVFFPTIENIPTLKSVSYIKNKNEFKETYFTDKQIHQKYEDVVYQLTLSYLYGIFAINTSFCPIESVVLNGMVKTIDKSTGKDADVYFLSVRETYENFSSLDLYRVNPKAWFRSSRGIAAAEISRMTPVQPIQVLNMTDNRFVEGYSVVDSVNEKTNLAAMDWQDFENLIQQIFELEFQKSGGEVKITQASRDGGVDAVAFDPDPIRGGKIVIQAKRYTNVVGVSAVRDLYGTLMNEGAMKGILVTTSYFGNDAYDFAVGKPLQLINGAQLLGLLSNHGYNATIDLQEAKKILKDVE